jgi:uncharacterized protein YlzI (FlbEa/FlbD family)
MVTLTRIGGHSVAVNPAQIAFVRDRAGDDKPTVIVMSNGTDFEVEESYDAVLAALSA